MVGIILHIFQMRNGSFLRINNLLKIILLGRSKAGVQIQLFLSEKLILYVLCFSGLKWKKKTVGENIYDA